MTAGENKSDLSFNTVIPNSFNVRTTNPLSLITAMSPTHDPESTALLVDVDRNDIDSISDQEPNHDVHTAPSTTSQQSYEYFTSSSPGPQYKKHPRFRRVIKGVPRAISLLTIIGLIFLMTYKILLNVTGEHSPAFDTSSIDHAINNLGVVLCILFVCSSINVLTTPPLLLNMLVDLILPTTLFHFAWVLSEATLGRQQWCERSNYWVRCENMKDACRGLGITVCMLTLGFAIAQIALLILRSILYFERKTWRSPIRLPVGDYRLELRIKICKYGEEACTQEV